MVRMMGTDDNITGPVNIGNPHEFTIKELAEKVVKLTGSSSVFVNRELPMDDPKQRQPDISMAKELLGWKPITDLDEGLVKTISYFKNLEQL
jgi:UDP-glucuronate decarboxylase